MNQLLYITCNTKPENISTSKTVGRNFVNKFLKENPNYYLKELELYDIDIPEVTHRYFTSRASLVRGEEYENLSPNEKRDIDRVIELCDEFIEADTYVFATPMWSTNFPSRLKRYLDCIFINGKTIYINNKTVVGLLDDKPRNMIYIQSSGGKYNPLLNRFVNHGLIYMKDVFKFLGIESFKSILIEGTEDNEIGKDIAILNAIEQTEYIADRLH